MFGFTRQPYKQGRSYIPSYINYTVGARTLELINKLKIYEKIQILHKLFQTKNAVRLVNQSLKY